MREEIAVVEGKLQQLRASFNSQSSVGKLPPEILSQIFLIHAAMVREERIITRASDKAEDLVHRSYYGWLNVSHVCRQWREITLGCVKLWTWLAFDPRMPDEFLQAAIKRARDLPFTLVMPLFNRTSYCHGCLSVDRFQEHVDSAIDNLHKLFPRCQELTILIDWDEDDHIWEYLDGPADLLEIVHIEAVGSARVTEMHSPFPILPERFLASHTSRLHSVFVSGVAIDSPNAMFSASLRHLEISDCEFDAENTLQPFFLTLRATPFLETLKISWPRTFLLDPTPSEGHETVTLPHLRQFHITAACSRVTALLLHIHVPRTAILQCKLLDTVAPTRKMFFQDAFRSIFTDETAHTVSYALGEPIHIISSDTVCRIWCASTEEGASGESQQAESWTQEAEESLPAPRLTIDSTSSLSPGTISTALEALNLAKLRRLLISGSTTGSTWASVLQGARALTCLRMTGISAFAIPSLLAEGRQALNPTDVVLRTRAGMDEWHWARFGRPDEPPTEGELVGLSAQWELGAVFSYLAAPDTSSSDAETPGREDETDEMAGILFPQLRVLQIVDVDLSLPEGRKPRGMQGYRHAAAVDIMRFKASRTKYGFDVVALAKCLKMRRAQGVPPMVRIEFEGCHCEDTAELAPLAGLGVEVRWDGLRVD